jgi:hypothetical protein
MRALGRTGLAALIACAFVACSSGGHDIAASRATTTSDVSTSTSTTLSEAQAKANFDAAAAQVPKYELGSVPPGFQAGVAEADIGDFTMSYAAKSGRSGERLTLRVHAPPYDDALGYVHLSDQLVRGSKQAKYFIVSDHNPDAHARHALTWTESPTCSITIFAFNTDPAFFVRLAESVRARSV